MEAYCFADGWGFIQETTECSIPFESVRQGDLKKTAGRRPFVTLTNKAYSSFIIDSGKIIHISSETNYNPLQESEAIFSKNVLTILDRIFEIFCTCIKYILHYKQ